MFGNFISALLSIPVPLITRMLFIPYLFHPSRWGGHPWTPPSELIQTGLSVVINLLIIFLLGILSNIMVTLKTCNKKDLSASARRASWTVIGWVIGSIVIFFLPFLKAPLLTFTIAVPFAGYLVTGLLVSIFVYIFSEIGNNVIISDVC